MKHIMKKRFYPIIALAIALLAAAGVAALPEQVSAEDSYVNLKIVNVDHRNTEQTLSGMNFRVYANVTGRALYDRDGNPVDTTDTPWKDKKLYVIGKSGTLTFSGLPATSDDGTYSYYFQEYRSPEGDYQTSDNPVLLTWKDKAPDRGNRYECSLDGDTLTITVRSRKIEDPPQYSNLKIRKIDEDTSEPLADVKFKLSCLNTAVMADGTKLSWKNPLYITTDENGEAKVEGLPNNGSRDSLFVDNYSYDLTEIENPNAGYETPPSYSYPVGWSVDTTHTGPAKTHVYTVENRVENSPYGRLSVKLIDKETNKPLAGGTFTLWSAQPGDFTNAKDEPIGSSKNTGIQVVTDEKGVAVFRGLPINNSADPDFPTYRYAYYLCETAAPGGYESTGKDYPIAWGVKYNTVENNFELRKELEPFHNGQVLGVTVKNEKSNNPAAPTDPADPTTGPADPTTGPVDPTTGPADPTDPAAPTGTADPTGTPAPTGSADLTGSADPTDPASPGKDEINIRIASNGALSKGAPAAEAHKAIIAMKTDDDPPGSTYGPLKLRSSKQGKKNITLRWNRAGGTERYVLYGNRCGKKMKKIATISKGKKSMKVKKIARKKLKAGKYYKFIIVAVDKNENVVATSKVIHVVTKGGKKKNHKAVKLIDPKKNSVTLKKGKKMKVKAKAVGKNVSKHVGLRYESSNPKIAKVSAKGVVRAKSKGSCKIYIYAQNGKSKVLQIKVK